MIYFIHQSAKDYIVSGNDQRIFPSNTADEHGKIIHRSLEVMSNALKKDIYDLKKPAAMVSEVERNFINGPLACIGYACSHWVHHLADCTQQDRDILLGGGKVHKFLMTHLLHWLEALSLIGKVSESVRMLTNLESMIVSALTGRFCEVLI